MPDIFYAVKGWSITDDPDDLRKWNFPDLTFVGGGYYVLFASGMAQPLQCTKRSAILPPYLPIFLFEVLP